MRFEDIAYDVDGQQMVGYLALDEYRPGPTPSCCPMRAGQEEHVKGRAVRLAGLGSMAFALDYHGGGRMLPMERAMERLALLSADADLTRRLGRARRTAGQDGVDPGRVAAIGYCCGGAMSLELTGSGADLKAVVGFRPGFTPPNPTDSRNIRASVLICTGADDPLVTKEQRQAFQDEVVEAGVADWRMKVYGGTQHCFTSPEVDELGLPGLAFNPAADRRSWCSMLDLFEETLGPV